MYRLLIVDDEPIAVNALAALFCEAEHLNLEVYQAFSAIEALDWLNRAKMDVVLSDIRMPGMNGLELQKEIIRKWPKCRIIFLTGYNDFAYIQTAMRNNSADYLLKTEGNEAILKAVETALSAIRESTQMDSLLSKAKEQLKLALPSLKNEYLWDLLQGDSHSLQVICEQFKELQISLHPDHPVLLVIGRVDNWQRKISPSDRMRLLYAVQNVVEEHSADCIRLETMVYERSKLVWFIQPKSTHAAIRQESLDPNENSVQRFVQGVLEQIQSICSQLLKIQISFAVSEHPVPWHQTAQEFDQLNLVFSSGIGAGTELLVATPSLIDNSLPNLQRVFQPLFTQLKKIELLRTYLEAGHKEDFCKIYLEVMKIGSIPSSSAGPIRLEIYHALCSLFLNYLNRHGLLTEISQQMEISGLTRFEPDSSWENVTDYFNELAQFLFDHRVEKSNNQREEWINRIKQYIEDNLADDLSLTKLGEVVSLNPSYLSRLFKQATGESLSDFILEARLAKAKELLVHTHLKIPEISKAVGFISDPYFYRFFKKATNLTPQEFRVNKRQ